MDRARRSPVVRAVRAFHRSAIASVVVLAACVGTLVVHAGGASADDSSWVPGTAQAISQALALAPSTAGLGYNVTLATSIADFQQDEAQAQSQTFDGGALVLALTSTQCDGTKPVVENSQLPQPTQAESVDGNSSQDRTLTTGVNGSGVGAGVEHAAVTTQPQATAATQLADLSVPGVISIDGGASAATATQVPGQSRTATATSDIGEISLGGGVVTLDGLHWQTTQQTGPDNSLTQQTGSFSIGSITVAGVTTPVTAVDLDTVLGIANTALSPLGLHVGPTPTLQTNPANRSTAVGPLAIGIDDSALGRQIVGTALGQSGVETVRDAIVNALLGVSCKIGDGITVGDVLLGVLSGGGNLDLELGGADAVSDGTAYANPFADTLGLLGADNVVGGGSTADTGTPGSYTPGTAGTAGTLGTTGASAGGGGVIGPLTKTLRCLTTSPFGHPGCGGGGAALPVGLVGLTVVLGMGTADYVRVRRLRRALPQEEIA
ncbi:MAG TPA: hypothetical protein VEI83_00225 [Acidimicrobiales bacterium]|nr:hypothetical protein [Acidimicrobiales bacterium]